MNFISTFEELNKLYDEANAADVPVKEGIFSKKPSYALIVKYTEEDAKSAGSEWYAFAVSSDINKLKSREKSLRADWSKHGMETETQVVDYKTAKTMVAKSEWDGAENLDETFKSETSNKNMLDEDIMVEDEEVEDVIDDEAPVEEPVARQLALECANCGAITIRDEADVKVDEETDLANMEDTCEFCEEAKGHKIVGVVTPYEEEDEEIEIVDDEEDVTESLTEGKLLDNIKKVATRVGADATTFVRTFSEFGDMIRNIGNNGEYKSSKATDFWEYIENKAVLKALMNGNEKVMNSLTKEDIEELKQDIEDYKNRKAGETDVEESLAEGFTVKYGRGKSEVKFDTLEDAVNHINDGMKKKAEDSYILYNNGKEMIWLDWYQASRDGSNNAYTVSRQDDKNTIKFDPNSGLSVVGDLDERYYDDEVGNGRDRNTPYDSQKGKGVWKNDGAPQWWKQSGRSESDWNRAKSSSINSWDDDNRYNR